MSIIIGLTGPTGSGKSCFSEFAARRNYFVINCDASARKAAYRSSPMVKELVAVFGEDILDSDGELDRKKLAEKAFADDKSTMLLNRTSLPHIVRFIKSEIESAKDNDVIILDAPTLFESGMDSICDAVIAVLADDDVRLERITERDRITIEEAELRMRAGKDEEFYTNRTELVLYNNADIEVFEENANAMLNRIIGGLKNGKE